MCQFPIDPSPDNIRLAKAFVLAKWRERAVERGMPEPADLSLSCKFSSMFANQIFGGRLRGNWDHQFVELDDGAILDLNEDCADVSGISDPYRHDPLFWKNPDHRKSMRSCEPRVAEWIMEFRTTFEIDPPPVAPLF